MKKYILVTLMLTMFVTLSNAKDGMWTGGTIMDPQKSSNYGCSIWFEQGDFDILNVRGKHWSGLYRTQKWYRVTGK